MLELRGDSTETPHKTNRQRVCILLINPHSRGREGEDIGFHHSPLRGSDGRSVLIQIVDSPHRSTWSVRGNPSLRPSTGLGLTMRFQGNRRHSFVTKLTVGTLRLHPPRRHEDVQNQVSPWDIRLRRVSKRCLPLGTRLSTRPVLKG